MSQLRVVVGHLLARAVELDGRVDDVIGIGC